MPMLGTIAHAQCCHPKTLLQWSCGNSFGGGADRCAPLVADRPDFTESSSTVGKGTVQFELGYTYTYDSTPTTSVETHSRPEALARIGIWKEWLELRIATNGLQETATVTNQREGTEDLYLGFKIGLTPQEGCRPEMALLVDMTVPSGSAWHTSGEVLPGGALIYGWQLSEDFSTAGQKYLEVSQSWTLAALLTDKVGSYVEWYAFLPHGADSNHTEHYLNGGFTYSITNDLQIDFRIGTGLNDAADDYFLGTGFVIRL